jgi:hypothetical protein
MNTENIIKLRDHIAGLSPAKFDIKYANKCILGQSFKVLGTRMLHTQLDITLAEFVAMCAPVNYVYEHEKYTIPVVVNMFNHLLETGEVKYETANQTTNI